MAYTHNQRQVWLALAASTASLAVIARLNPGLQPVIIRGVALVFTVGGAAAGIAELNLRPTPGSATNEVAQGTLDFDATSGAVGRVAYLDDLHIEVLPGQEFTVEITDVSASGVVDVVALIEERWENPANIAEMTEV